MVAKLKLFPGSCDVNSDQQNGGLQAMLEYDRPTAARLGITPQPIDNTLYDAFGQRQVSTMYTALNQYHVVMEADPAFGQGPEALRYIYVNGTGGKQVPLSRAHALWPATTPLQVNHSGQFPSVTISLQSAPGCFARHAVDRDSASQPARSLPISIHGSFSGAAQAFQDLGNEADSDHRGHRRGVYRAGILYESYIHPITILSTLPSAGVGALLALLVTGSELNVISLIGIILLIGIVKKNAIMMIDFALEAERRERLSPEEADLQGVRTAVQAHHHDDDGGAAGRTAAGAGERDGIGTAPAARHCDCGRLDLQPGADAVYDAGDLSLPRSASHLVCRASRKRLARRSRRSSAARLI